MKFFENGMEGARAHWVDARGWWYDGSGEGLSLPSDLTAVGLDADKWDEEWTLWYSPWLGKYFRLQYNDQSTEWLGVKMSARSVDQAKAELESVP